MARVRTGRIRIGQEHVRLPSDTLTASKHFQLRGFPSLVVVWLLSNPQWIFLPNDSQPTLESVQIPWIHCVLQQGLPHIYCLWHKESPPFFVLNLVPNNFMSWPLTLVWDETRTVNPHQPFPKFCKPLLYLPKRPLFQAEQAPCIQPVQIPDHPCCPALSFNIAFLS